MGWEVVYTCYLLFLSTWNDITVSVVVSIYVLCYLGLMSKAISVAWILQGS